MPEAVLAVVVVALLVERFFSERTHSSQTRRWMNLLEARTPQEYAMLEKITETPRRSEPGEPREVIQQVGV